MVHFDNCLVHISRTSTDWLEGDGMLRMYRMTHPHYSPDVASSNFYLFLIIKEQLERIQVADEDQFLKCLQEMLKGLDQQELDSVFQASVG
jgi:hypothetical protein